MNNGIVHIDVSVLQFIVGTLIPFVVALVAQRFSDERVKSAVAAVAALIVALVQIGIKNGGDFDLPTIVGQFVTMLIAAYFAHQFVWKPLHLTGDHGVIQKSVPMGVGRPVYGDPYDRTSTVTPTRDRAA